MKNAGYYFSGVFLLVLIAAVLGNFGLFAWLFSDSGILSNGVNALKGSV